MVTTRLIVTLLLGLLASPVWAAGLVWDYDTTQGAAPTASDLIDVRKGPNSNGPFSTVATIPAQPPSWTLPASPDQQWYIVQYPHDGAASNSVQYVALASEDDDTALHTAIDDLAGRVSTVEAKDVVQDTSLSALAARVSALEGSSTVTPSTNLSVKALNADQVEITGGASCTKLSTTGSGLRRVVTCIH